jgi:hypothetical protein
MGDLHENESVVALAAYADDLVVLTPVLPLPEEKIADYFQRLDILDGADHRLLSPTARRHAILEVSVEKSGTTYSRAVGTPDEAEPDEDDDDAHELGQIDPYLESDPGAEWGGLLRTVLRAAQRRERAPRALERKLESLVGEISVGLDAETTGLRLREIVEALDVSVFLRLRRFWVDLAVAGAAASGRKGIQDLTNDFVAAAASVTLTPDAPEAQRQALVSGLRASWVLAVAQALAFAMSEDQRAGLASEVPTLITDAPIADVSTASVVEIASLIRSKGLVPAQFVSVPLSEFTPWSGRLLGAGVFGEFVEWARDANDDLLAALRARVARSIRFIQLHEACLAIHLWASPATTEWLNEAFDILRGQPLLREEDLDTLREIAVAAVEPPEPVLPPEDERELLRLRVAMPSLRVRADQLDAILGHDALLQAAIIGESRKRTQIVVRAAAKRRASVLVLPEWAVLPEQLGWLMNQCRRADMLVVAGQSPTVSGGTYSNQLWTGLPLRDHANRRACLVPPPRQKNYLSPHEQQSLLGAGIGQVPGGAVPTYRWRGLGVASLICFEFADVSTRHRLRSTADLLTVSSWNQDWRYFDAIQESTTRDNYCITFCVNTSEFPGTRLMRPTRNEKAVMASVHGSDFPAVVMRKVDLLPVVAARATGSKPSDVLEDEPWDDADLADYKPVPPVW